MLYNNFDVFFYLITVHNHRTIFEKTLQNRTNHTFSSNKKQTKTVQTLHFGRPEYSVEQYGIVNCSTVQHRTVHYSIVCV